ncbi:MAG TPA: hypothetical protein VI408_03665 [Gaiellaceae bacterium]
MGIMDTIKRLLGGGGGDVAQPAEDYESRKADIFVDNTVAGSAAVDASEGELQE